MLAYCHLCEVIISLNTVCAWQVQVSWANKLQTKEKQKTLFFQVEEGQIVETDFDKHGTTKNGHKQATWTWLNLLDLSM